MVRLYGVDLATERRAFSLLALILGAITFIGLVHSFRALYHRWLAFAERLQRVAVTVLFGATYLLVVPWFSLLGRIIAWRRAGRQLGATGHWVARRRAEYDEKYFTRMG